MMIFDYLDIFVETLIIKCNFCLNYNQFKKMGTVITYDKRTPLHVELKWISVIHIMDTTQQKTLKLFQLCPLFCIL